MQFLPTQLLFIAVPTPIHKKKSWEQSDWFSLEWGAEFWLVFLVSLIIFISLIYSGTGPDQTFHTKRNQPFLGLFQTHLWCVLRISRRETSPRKLSWALQPSDFTKKFFLGPSGLHVGLDVAMCNLEMSPQQFPWAYPGHIKISFWSDHSQNF